MQFKGIVLSLMLIISLTCIVVFFITSNKLLGFIGYLILFMVQLYELIDGLRKRNARKIEK